jgi:N-acetylneuraminate synthase
MTIVIGEISGNHSGDLNKAKELIVAAKYSGCDMVKFQAYKPEDMPDDGGDYEKLAVPLDWYGPMFETARNVHVPLFASVFSHRAIADLLPYKPLAYKIASPESTRLSFDTYQRIAVWIKSTGAKFFVSTGARDLPMMRDFGADVLFYCVAGYPALIGDEDIAFMAAEEVQGFSDHTVGIGASLAMIAAGARYIEKHFKVDEDCVDAVLSLSPRQMQTLCRLAHRCNLS